MKGYIISSLFLFVITLSAPISAQKIQEDKSASVPFQIYEPGVIVNTAYMNGKLIDSVKVDMNESINVIVRLNEKPLAAAYSKLTRNKYINNAAGIISRIETEHQKFKNDLRAIEQNTPLKNSYKTVPVQIHQEYEMVINGFAVTVKRWMLDEIKKLSYVKSVDIDREVTVCDTESNHIIGADSVSIKLGYSGKGIKIGIIDTGIDYMHPDLGGGFGNAFKVKGGYDCINNDSNPLDDNGHGTHVAGIAAANGAILKGVAPEADLYAYKVLNSSGMGTTSSVISGIERATNPDNDPATNDALDIINLSLSSNVYGQDPLSESINNATAAGIVCVVAAGNTGSQYNTIGSPGCVKSAITVAASDKNDKVANFSSRGPSQVYYGMKPDITAPGVAINSTINGGGYEVMEGTSMAAPHIAGCAALILQKYPDWAPSRVKSLLMQTARDIGYNCFTQGSGRVDILKALTSEVFFSPMAIDLGLADVSKTEYSIIDTIRIFNSSGTGRTYYMNSSSVQTGINISISPVSVTVPPNDYKEVIITTTINNNVLPNSFDNPPAYKGTITALSAEDTIKIPFALIKSPVLNINLDDEPFVIYIFKNSGEYYIMFDPGKNITRYLTSGNYNIIIGFRDMKSYVIKENIGVSTVTNLSISKNEAKNKIKVIGIDENNNTLNSLIGYYLFSHKPSTFECYSSGGISMELNLSDFSDQFIWEQQSSTYGNSKRFYSFNGYLKNGCSADVTFKNDPLNFKHLTYDLTFPPEIDSVYLLYVYAHIGMLGNYEPLTTPVKQEIYLSPLPYEGFGENHITGSPYFFQIFYPYNAPFSIYNTKAIYHTSMLSTPNKDISEVHQYLFLEPVDVITGNTYTSGMFAPHWAGMFSNNTSYVYAYGNFDNQALTTPTTLTNYFYFPMKDWTPLPDQRFVLWKNNNILDSGRIYERENLSFYAPEDKYVFESGTDKYYINGKQGNATVRLEFDTHKTDKNPPYMKSLKILANNEITDHLESSQPGKIEFGFVDDTGINKSELYYHSEYDTVWRNLSLSGASSLLTAEIPDKIPDEFISLRFIATDNSGNSLDYIVEPAFRVTGWNTSPVIEKLSVDSATEDSLYRANIIAVDTEGDLLTYYLENNYEWLSVNASTGEITGIPRKQQTGNLQIKIRVVDDKGGSVSGVYKLFVKHVNHSPVINCIADTIAFEDSLYKLNLNASDADSDPLSYYPQIIPSWLQLDSSRGILTGIPSRSNIGDTLVSVFVKDTSGASAWLFYNLHVLHTNHHPVIQALSDTIAFEDKVFFSTVRATDQDNDTLLYNAHTIPAWAKLDSIKGTIEGIPLVNDIGQNIFTIGVNDRAGGRGTKSFNVYVYHTNHTPSGISLISPSDKDTILLQLPPVPVSFKWSGSMDVDVNDTLTYCLSISGPLTDTLITGIKDTSVSLDIMPMLMVNSEYRWSVNVTDGFATVAAIDTFLFVTSVNISGIINSNIVPNDYFLAQNYPNPFNPSTIISYGIPKDCFVKLKVYNILGKEVVTLVNEVKSPGMYNEIFDGKDLSSGVYLYTIQAGAFVSSRKFILIK